MTVLAANFNTILEEPEKIPGTDCRNNLLLKSQDSKEVRNYRLIMCLTIMFKTLTGITARRISINLEEWNLFPAEPKGCHTGSKGCKDQLMISKAIYEDCKRRRKTLSVA
jgi:hypothetical protein